ASNTVLLGISRASSGALQQLWSANLTPASKRRFSHNWRSPEGCMVATANHVKVPVESSKQEADRPQNPSNAWGDRVRALKNVPAVLHFVWESGPSVVFWNIFLRIAVSFLPVGVGIIGRFIIDGVNTIRLHLPLPPYFWWLVAAEMALAVTIGVMS